MCSLNVFANNFAQLSRWSNSAKYFNFGGSVLSNMLEYDYAAIPGWFNGIKKENIKFNCRWVQWIQPNVANTPKKIKIYSIQRGICSFAAQPAILTISQVFNAFRNTFSWTLKVKLKIKLPSCESYESSFC